MSTQGIRDFRPKAHFSTEKGWINDPNGLVRHGGKYHLFYQHYPNDGVWGPMHWGHAVSEDLIQWEHLPIAIYPDQDGMIFSGSAVADTENLSGLGKAGAVPLIALYTCHGDVEEQAIAYSLDGVNFTKYEKNPVIPNPGIKDFRDPKMFWNPVKDCWSMVLAAKDRVHFYATRDLLSWEKTGEFGPEGNLAPGVWECPDMVPLELDGKTVWMLIVSMTAAPGEERVNAQYFLGDFDGDAFICSMPFGIVEKIDCGFDNYAGVTFNNADEPIFIGWGMNWVYSRKTPTGVYCGQMTLPRKLSLKETPSGIRLASAPMGIQSYIGEGKALENGGAIDSETFLIRVKGSGACSVTLSNDKGQSLSFGVDAENSVFVDRANAGAKDFDEYFASAAFCEKKVKRYLDGAYSIDFIFDVSILELFIDEGTRNMTMVCYPDAPYTSAAIEGDVEARFFDVKF